MGVTCPMTGEIMSRKGRVVPRRLFATTGEIHGQTGIAEIWTAPFGSGTSALPSNYMLTGLRTRMTLTKPLRSHRIVVAIRVLGSYTQMGQERVSC